MDNFLDIVNGDAFSFTTLTAAINKVEQEPFKLGQILNIEEKGINTLTATVEETEGKIRVIKSTPRGGNGVKAQSTKRKVRSFAVPHYVEEDSILATEVQGRRQFGSTSLLETVEARKNEKFAAMRKNHEITAEFGRAGMVQGVLYDADGSVLYDWFDEFELDRNTHTINIGNPATDLRKEAIALKRKSEAKLGGYLYRGFYWLLTAAEFDAVIAHPSLYKMYERWMEGAALRNDPRKGLQIADNVTLMSYEPNNVGDLNFLPTNKSFFLPDADGLYHGRFAPADTVEAAGTDGLPFYGMAEPMKFGRGVDLQTESNFVYFNEKPDTVVEVTLED